MNLVREVILEHFRRVQHELRSQVLPGKKVPAYQPIRREPIGGPWDVTYKNLYMALNVQGAFGRITAALTRASDE